MIALREDMMTTTGYSGQRLGCHQHFWSLEWIARGGYDWMPEEGVLREDYLPERLRPHLDQANVAGTIVVQASPTVEETRFCSGWPPGPTSSSG
jgi:predicted TIM-barrel fold metal-dependent hydrolase